MSGYLHDVHPVERLGPLGEGDLDLIQPVLHCVHILDINGADAPWWDVPIFEDEDNIEGLQGTSIITRLSCRKGTFLEDLRGISHSFKVYVLNLLQGQHEWRPPGQVDQAVSGRLHQNHLSRPNLNMKNYNNNSYHIN